jgi:hypothetical protein
MLLFFIMILFFIIALQAWALTFVGEVVDGLTEIMNGGMRSALDVIQYFLREV